MYFKNKISEKIVGDLTDAAVCFPPASCPSVLDSSYDDLDDFVGKMDLCCDK